MKNGAAGPELFAALGHRVHSGWAAMVAVAGPLAQPVIVDRRRIELVECQAREYLQPYHAAAELDLGEAEPFIKLCFATSRSIAIRALGTVIERLRKDGYRMAGCGILLSSGRPSADLGGVLRSHAMIHTAEGHFFREALQDACRHHGLAITAVRERELHARASAELGAPQEELQRKVAELGRRLGPPWTQDQKCAALVACLALAAQGRSLEESKTAAR